MKISIAKTLALGGLCALFAGAVGSASAQSYGTRGMHHGPVQARRHIQHLKADYARAVAHGNYGAAERAHLKARAIRHHVRTRREMMHRDMHRDHGF